ncbi:hypothetical protein JNUCC64_14170 [Streptomyces sp. JNUCC 64]
MNQAELPPAYAPLARDDGRQGPFIVLEGVSGVGKTTLARLLMTRFKGTSPRTLPEPHGAWSRDSHMRPLPQLALLKRLRENFETVASADPTAVVLPTDGLTLGEPVDRIATHLGGPRA